MIAGAPANFGADEGADGGTGVGATLGELSARTRLLQSGLTRSYALYMLIGAVLVIAAMLGGGVL